MGKRCRVCGDKHDAFGTLRSSVASVRLFRGKKNVGMNYYHHQAVCPHCKKPNTVEHIGKASSGWTFTFHGTEYIRSWAKWQEVLLSGGLIVDEYGEEHTLDDFEALVDAKQHAAQNHTTYMREHYGSAGGNNWLDPEGHSFSEGEFS